MSLTIERLQDNVYLNVVFNHPQPTYPIDQDTGTAAIATGPVPMEYVVNKTLPILDKCSDYYCSVIRFDIPMDEIPLYYPQIIPKQADPNKTVYIIGILYNGVHYSINVSYTPNNTFFPVPVQNQDYQVITPYYYCYTYQALLDDINEALEYVYITSGYGPTIYPSSYNTGTASQTGTTVTGVGTVWISGMEGGYIVYANGDFAQIISVNSGTSITVDQTQTEAAQAYTIYYGNAPVAPFFWYNSTTQLFNLVVPPELITDGVSIFINEPLQTLFNSFQLSYRPTGTPNGQPYGADYYFILNDASVHQIVTYDSIEYYQFTQEYATNQQWTSLRKILVTTNSIPVQNEIIPTFTNTGSQTSISASFPIITDFIPQIEPANAASSTRSIAYYIPSSQYRLVDMISDNPLYSIDLKVFWQDKYGNLYPVLLSCTQQASIKLAFVRKSLYKPMNLLLGK